MAYKILCVDDEEAILTLFERAFENTDYTIYTARDGVEALEQVREHRPDLVFLDVVMPKMTGDQVLPLIHEIDPSIIVIIVSGQISDDEAREFLAEGAFDFFPKPIDLEFGAEPQIIKELQWMGINLVSCGNNHAYDYGAGGVLTNIKNLDEAGLAHAGSGSNLAEAREPAYLDTNQGRVALISCADTGIAECTQSSCCCMSLRCATDCSLAALVGSGNR